MFEVFSQTKYHQPDLWAVTTNDRNLQALLLPVRITLQNGVFHSLTTRAVVYGSVLHEPGPAGEAALQYLLQAYRREVASEVLFTELRNLSDLGAIQPVLNSCGFAYEDHLNYLIDLNRPVDEVLQGIGRRTRKHIRRGLARQEVVVEELTERSQLPTCYNLLQKSYLATGVPLADQSLFEAIFDVLIPRHMVKFWLVRIAGTYVATSVELLYRDVIYGWYAGVDRAYADHTPGELLMWQVLKWGVENSYRSYDFGGAGKPGEEYGVRNFKAKFGGELVCYGRNICVHAPYRLRVSKAGYALYRRFRYWSHAR